VIAPVAAALELLHLTGPAGRPLVHDVSLSVPRGRTHVLMGPIHSGKSTVLRHLVGLEVAERGELRIDGEAFELRGETEAALRRMRTRIGTVFAGSALFSRMSAVENVELPLIEHTATPPHEAREAARELLAEVGLRVDDEATPDELGRAEQRSVALARALALGPAVLLLDEPTGGLDAHAAATFDDAVERVQGRYGFGVLIFTHEVRYAYGRAQHVDVMAEGRVVAGGDPETLRASDHPVVRRLLDRRERR
jgi:phospholipid/cholesterol/gamma-HCH transport system ATP-binding protein